MKFINFFGSIASIIGLPITLFSVDWKDFSFEDNWVKLCIAFVLLVLLIVFLVNANNKYKNESKGNNEIASLPPKVSKMEKELAACDYAVCQMKMYILCSKIAEIFKLIKGVEISVCIKIITQPDEIKLVKTIARDANSLHQRSDLDDPQKDKFEDNSDFCDLFYQNVMEKIKWEDVYYIANNLPHKYTYRNSHLQLDKLSDGIKGFFTRHFEWHLPYKSTLIVAIPNIEKDELYAFLCIDSKKSFCFYDNDIQHLKNIAHVISRLVGITIAKSQYKIVNG